MNRLPGLAVAALLATACTPPRIGGPPPRLHDRQAEHAYQELLGRYSAHDEVYGGRRFAFDPAADARLFAAATFQSWRFREARARRTAAFRSEPPSVLEKRLATERLEDEVANTFFLGVHLNDPLYDDFDRDNSIWRLAMVTGVGEAAPLSIRRIGRSNLNLRALYPYLDDFWVAYEVRFPKRLQDGRVLLPEGEATLTLRLASTLGKAELKIHPR